MRTVLTVVERKRDYKESVIGSKLLPHRKVLDKLSHFKVHKGQVKHTAAQFIASKIYKCKFAKRITIASTIEEDKWVPRHYLHELLTLLIHHVIQRMPC